MPPSRRDQRPEPDLRRRFADDPPTLVVPKGGGAVRGIGETFTANPANDAQPMWHRGTIYFLSDRGPSQRNNIWAYDVSNGQTRQITQFDLSEIEVDHASRRISSACFCTGSDGLRKARRCSE